MSKQKLIDQIKINPEYEKLVPKLTEDEYIQLKQSIKKKGQWVPIFVNTDEVVLDGHHRFRACQALGVEPRIKHMPPFTDKLDEKEFVIESNLRRRQLEDWQKIDLAEKLMEIEQERARQRQGKRTDLTSAQDCADVEFGKSVKKVAEKVNMKPRLLEYGLAVKKAIKDDPERYREINESIKQNGNKYHVSTAYKELNKEKKKTKLHEALRQTQVNLPETVQLHNQKFQDLKLKPNSVSLIFTDPPYEEKSLYLYKDLAKQAAKVLRDGGSLMCYAGHFCIDRVIEYMKDEGLKYHWIIAVVHSGPSASVFGRKILVGYKPLLWFTKGKYEGEFVKDLIKSEFQGKELHEWAQSTVESDYYIKYLTLENDIVYDPFMGQGTFGTSTVRLKRQFIGCEIDKQHFENAQRMISIANKS